MAIGKWAKPAQDSPICQTGRFRSSSEIAFGSALDGLKPLGRQLAGAQHSAHSRQSRATPSATVTGIRSAAVTMFTIWRKVSGVVLNGLPE